MLDFFLWFLLIELLALASAPAISLMLPRLRDRGYGVSKALGLFTLGSLLWFSDSFFIVASTKESAVAILVALLLIGYILAHQYYGGFWSFLRRIQRHVLAVEGLFAACVLFFLIIRAFQPEIHWGEKPMDFSFLNYFIRLNDLPPEDPWAAGRNMHYYYFGYYLFALLHKLSGVDPALGYNLTIITLPALFVSALYSLLATLCKDIRWAIAGSSAVLLLSNLEAMYLSVVKDMPLDSHLFWATTRVFVSPGLAEYPLWSYLFADLHPHVMTLPFTAVLLVLGTRLVCLERKFTWSLAAHRVLYAIVWGSFLLLNSWDFITYGILTAVLILYRPFGADRPTKEPVWQFATTRLLLRSGELALLCLPAIGMFSVLLRGDTQSVRPQLGWVSASEFNSLTQLARVLGVWVIPIASIVLLITLRQRSQFGTHGLSSVTRIAALACLPFVLAMAASLSGSKGLPWVLITCSSLLIACTSYCFWREELANNLRVVGACITTATLIVCVAELVYLMDRMNTLFKFYNAVWTFFGVSAAALVPLLFSRTNSFRNAPWTRLVLWPVRGVVGVVLFLGVSSTAINLYIQFFTSLHWSKPGPRPTLDGTRFLDFFHSDQSVVIDWINRNISGTPILLEAFGPSYQQFSRICTYTGLPIVLGWEHHVYQRGTSRGEIRRRKRDIRTIYTTTDPEKAAYLLNKYQVELIVVGELEEKTYPGPGLKKFAQHPEFFPLLTKSGGTSLYAFAKRG
jgi:YYY domain-containing protein